MKFVLHEVKLWFKDKNSTSKSYEFLPDKVNVITGDATTGKTSFWSIIDYCLLSSQINIANTIIERVLWYGIRFSINDKEISIARKSPVKGAVSSEIFYSKMGFIALPHQNITKEELATILDTEFGINDSLRYPYGKGLGITSLNLTYRYFLLFNSLTEDIIGSSKTYFDTTFYGKEEYDKALRHIFNLVIGVNDMENIKARERLEQIAKEVQKIENFKTANINIERRFENGIYSLINQLKQNNFLEYSQTVESIPDALATIDHAITTTGKIADNSKMFDEINTLNKRKFELKSQISAIEKYRKEYDTYKRNLNKSSESLKPIEFLKNNLSDQLVDSYETQRFIDSLEESLKTIQSRLTKRVEEPYKVTGDAKKLNEELHQVEQRINELALIQNSHQTEVEKLMFLGGIRNAKEQLLKYRTPKFIDTAKLNKLLDEKADLEKNITEIGMSKFVLKTSLNECIQRNYNKLNSMPTYKNHDTIFNEEEMHLQLKPKGEFFALDNIGSKSNHMFMHLCFYLGLHEHILNVSPEHVPQFLFIDQPSIPYYSGSDAIGNDDKTKLLDAFSLINSFIDHINLIKKQSFQIFMVEHAPKEYWINNNLNNFHTVAEFINGKGLIPNDIYNN